MVDSATGYPITLFVLQAAGLVVIAFAGVGLFLRRSWSQVVLRLGLEKLQWQHLLISVIAVFALMAINFSISGIWLLINQKQAEDISQISNALLGSFDSFGSILLLAVLTGVSEEVLFRGALQPRLGIVLTSLLFASTHIQYAISPATLSVLIIGFVLGLLRRYFGTWTAVLTHFGYNFNLLLLGLLVSNVLELTG